MINKIKTKTGWEEIAIDKIIIDFKNSFKKPIYSVEHVICFVEKNPIFNKRGWNHCERCDIGWVNIKTGNVWLAFTNKGNKSICDKCKKELCENEIH